MMPLVRSLITKKDQTHLVTPIALMRLNALENIQNQSHTSDNFCQFQRLDVSLNDPGYRGFVDSTRGGRIGLFHTLYQYQPCCDGRGAGHCPRLDSP